MNNETAILQLIEKSRATEATMAELRKSIQRTREAVDAIRSQVSVADDQAKLRGLLVGGLVPLTAISLEWALTAYDSGHPAAAYLDRRILEAYVARETAFQDMLKKTHEQADALRGAIPAFLDSLLTAATAQKGD